MLNKKSIPWRIAQQLMLDNDRFSNLLGIEILEISEGHCKLQMTIQSEHLNGFGIAHGGISYSLADSALAFASNAYGFHCVSIETSISHVKPVKNGDIIIAIASEQNKSSKLAHYDVKMYTIKNQLVAIFKGIVFVKETKWDIQ